MFYFDGQATLRAPKTRKYPMHTLFQYLLPQQALSRLAGKLANCRVPRVKNWLIAYFLRRYAVNMSEAAQPDPYQYLDFNNFFTRELKESVRPLAAYPNAIISPADGSISQIGAIQSGRIFQAKNFTYDVQALLGGSADRAAPFMGGKFATIYLAPKDYHRVHMPFAGRLREMIHVPGQLFSVSTQTAEAIPNLFARNERVVAIFDTAIGPMAVVMVGAMLVASICTVWAGIVSPPTRPSVRVWNYADNPIELARGAEMGHFQLGSTVIVLFGAKQIEWAKNIAPTQPIHMGEMLGK